MSAVEELRRQIAAFLRFRVPAATTFETLEQVDEADYRRLLIRYPGDEGEAIPAFLFLPQGTGPFPAVLAHHQHNSQRHLGKSEIAGVAGDALQAFGPALARRGVVVLAPDSICFEDRRRNRSGIEADETADIAQHFNEMAYRLLRGDTLMRKVLDDSALAISLLQAQPQVDATRVGILGHSYGGNTVLFHAALDERIAFACASGAACSYAYKMAVGTPIELAEIVPGFAARFDIADLVLCMAERPALLLSASEDKYAQDAPQIVQAVRQSCAKLGMEAQLEHVHYTGGHALTVERFDAIVGWVNSKAGPAVLGEAGE